MSESHVAHLLASIQRVYALQQVGPYACDERVKEHGYARWAEL